MVGCGDIVRGEGELLREGNLRDVKCEAGADGDIMKGREGMQLLEGAI